ncbi:cytokine receptor family member b4 [Triplophysa rosa]|uniref:CRFB4 n=1 Tax=Triplophysa rosa TaxID=992332 RepID=A0A9W8C6W1_TRIRA|nr:cytokine receptor family member b4 [Triplophysa rosa]KAI7808634.1 CRFB4 [Triplophysa rosa]
MAFSAFSRLSTVLLYIGFISSEKIPVPGNVRVLSLDMGLQLTWDPPRNITDQLLNYTADLSGWTMDFESVCANISSLSCDFTDHVSTTFGTYRLRVRTELDGETSDWVETEEFGVDKITSISGPHVELKSRKGQTEVHITDPPMKKKNLRDVFGSISYLIRYWKEGEVTKEELIREQNRIMLPSLEPLVSYCVQVAVLCSINTTSDFSNVTCVTNTASDEVESWFIAVLLLVSFVVVSAAVLLIFLAVWSSYKVCRMIYPDANLPDHLKQYLYERPQSSVLLSAPPKENVHEVRILHEETHNTQQAERPIRAQHNATDCWTTVDVKERDEEQRLLDEIKL